MTWKLKDGVWETTSTSGLGSYALKGKAADAGALHRFGNVFADGDLCLVRVWGSDGEEEFVGQYDAVNDRVDRVRVYRSTNGDQAVDWPSGADRNIACQVGSGALESLLEVGSVGFVAQIAPESYRRRTITGGANIVVTDGDGVAGGPDIAVSPQGAGSGLDADTVQGYGPGDFAVAGHVHEGLVTSRLTGGSNSKILRASGDGTLTPADSGDDPDLLQVLYARGSDGKIYLPGSMVPYGGLATQTRYWLGSGGALVSGNGPTPNAAVTAALIGRCDVAGYLTFVPSLVVGG